MIFVALMLAGTGSRMHLDVPKQFIEINKLEIFEYPLKTFDAIKEIDCIILVINEKDKGHIINRIANLNIAHRIEIVTGGPTRQESVFNALQKAHSISSNLDDKILIHDACRPLVTFKLINNIINELNNEVAVVPALTMVDSLCLSSKHDYIDNNEDRSKYLMLQTPQGFNLNFIFKAHQYAINSDLNNFTDDTSLAIINGGKVKIVEGEKFNFKITTFDDLFLFKKLIGG